MHRENRERVQRRRKKSRENDIKYRGMIEIKQRENRERKHTEREHIKREYSDRDKEERENKHTRREQR